MKFQNYCGLFVFICSLVSYPVFGLLSSIFGLETQSITTPYRSIVLTISLITISVSLFIKNRIVIDKWLLIFLLMYLIRIIYDLNNNSIENNRFSVIFFIVVVCIPLTSILISNIFYFKESFIGKGLLAVGLFGGAMALLASAAGLGYNPWEDQGITDVRLGFTAVNPITLGNLGVTTTICGLFLLSEKDTSRMWQLLCIVAIAVGGVLAIRAGSRSALIALILCSIWFGFQNPRRLIYLIPIATVALVLGVTQSNVVLHTIDTIFEGGWQYDGSSLIRLEMQNIAINDFYDSPLYGKHHANPMLPSGYHPHNLFIETAMALGILGLILFSSLLIRVTFSVFRHFNRSNPLLTLLLMQQIISATFSAALWGADAFFILLALALQKPHHLQPKNRY